MPTVDRKGIGGGIVPPFPSQVEKIVVISHRDFFLRQKIMDLTLTRMTRRRGYTEGVLTDKNGKHLADTLEPQWRALDKGEKKVAGKTAIPEGTYYVVVTMSPRFGTYLPLLVGVPGFEGIRMHAGNNAEYDSRGCILLGERNGPGMIINSRVTVRRVTEMMMREKKIRINIKLKEQ